MLVTGETVTASTPLMGAVAAASASSHAGSHIQSHLHPQASHHQGSARAYLRTSASLVDASPDSDSEEDVDPSTRVFGQATPSNLHNMNINAGSAATNGHNTINRPTAPLSSLDSASVPPFGAVSFLLDDLRRMDHGIGTLEEALLRTEARSNRELQQLRQQQQMYQQLQQHHQQQHSSSQMHHISHQQLYQQLQQAQSISFPHVPTQQHQHSGSGNVAMLGPSESAPHSAALQQHAFLTSSSAPSSSSDPQLGTNSIPTQHPQILHHQPQLPQQLSSIASTMGILLFGRSGPAGPHAGGVGAVTSPPSATSSATSATGIQGSTAGINGNNGGLLPLSLHGHHHQHHSSGHQHGQVCLLTDSHDVAVRQHQLHVLSEMFPGIDFTRFIEAFACWVVLNGAMTAQPMAAAYQSILAAHAPKVQALLVRLVELEQFNADAVFASKQKDAHRSLEIIVGSADRSQDVDDVITRARNRSEDIAFVVRRLLAYFSQFNHP